MTRTAQLMIDWEESLEQNPFDRRFFERRPGRRLISELDPVMEEIVRKRMKRIEERPVGQFTKLNCSAT